MTGGGPDVLEVARFATLPEAELAADFLRRHDIAARLPDRDTATMNPDLLFALGGVRVVAPSGQVVEARRLIARMRAGEFIDDHDEWMDDAVPGRVGELDEAEVSGVMAYAKRAGTTVIVLFFLVLPMAGCLFQMLG